MSNMASNGPAPPVPPRTVTASLSPRRRGPTAAEVLARLAAREKELCDRKRLLHPKEVQEFADLHRHHAMQLDDDGATMSVVDRLQSFLSRPEVVRAINTSNLPRAPRDVVVEMASHEALRVAWQAPEAASAEAARHFHYEVQVGRKFWGGWTPLRVYRSDSVIHELSPKTTYLVRVRARNPLGWGPFSEAVACATDKAPSLVEAHGEGKIPGLWQLFSSIPEGYEELVKSIIRPPRAQYDMVELGARRFRIGRTIFVREDFELKNDRGHTLMCSHWLPAARTAKPLAAIIYLHGNCGCRADAIEVLEELLKNGFTLIGVDLSGSGKSEGEYISLGWHERADVGCIIRHLKSRGTADKIFLWGRSMGAVTALLCAVQDNTKSISGIVCDSPFSDLWALSLELVENTDIKIPKVATHIAKFFIRQSVRARAKCDIDDLAAVKVVDKCTTPVLFAAALGDDFVRPLHSKALHAKYGTSAKLPGGSDVQKLIMLFPGDHNSPRPKSFLSDAVRFFRHIRDQDAATAAAALACAETIVERKASDGSARKNGAASTSCGANRTTTGQKKSEDGDDEPIGRALQRASGSGAGSGTGAGAAAGLVDSAIKSRFQNHTTREHRKTVPSDGPSTGGEEAADDDAAER